MERAKEELSSGDALEEAEPAPGSHSTPTKESPSRSGNVYQDSPVLIGKEEEEAAGDSSSIDVLYPDPPDSYTGGLFPGSTSIDWSSPDSSGEGRNPEGGQENCKERASRPGNSRIPGKDHRRYYHSHWRLEYLMDFNARSHSMICMVCGSSLATLKLSTIKRHIQQKHPYSLTWTPCEKEVIIGGWDAHLCVDAQTLTGGEEQGADDITATPGAKKKRRRLPQVAKGSWLPVLGSEISLPPPPDRNQIEQVMNESFKHWLRLEFLIDYDCQGDKLYCMMCATTLPSLSINDLKIHILDNHPTSIYFNPAQKAIIIESWINHKDTPQEILDVEEEMDEDEEDEAEFDLSNNDLNEDDDDDDPVEKTIREERLQKNLVKENVNEDTTGNEEQNNLKVLEKSGLKPNKAQQLKKSKLESRKPEEEKTGEEKHSEQEELKFKKAKLNNEEVKDNSENTLEDQWKNRESTQFEENDMLDKQKPRSLEPQMLEKDKLKDGETKLLNKEQTKEAQQLEQEKCVDKEDQLNKKKHMATITPLLANEALKTKEVETHEEKQCNSTETHLEENTMKLKGQVLTSVVETAIKNIKEEPELLVEQKLPIIPETRIIKVQPAPQVQQTPQVQQGSSAMLGIGVPVLKMETPTPIIITRVSVLPDHTVITPPIPKPSTSTSDASKNYRVIAPKVIAPEEVQVQKPFSMEPSQWPTGVDPAIWEVSLWKENTGNSLNAFQCNAYQMRWRSDYLMEYNGLRGSVVCMYCCSSLTVLKDSSIKRHIVQKHPHTSNFSAAQKASIILDWENKLAEVKKLMAKQNKDGLFIDPGVISFKVPDPDDSEEEEQEPSWSGALSEGKGASWEFAFGRVQGAKDPRKYQHDRWKLEFLMDYTPNKDGLICMVCGVTLINPKITTVKMHIQQKHPDTIYLSDQEKAVVIEEWEQRLTSGKRVSGDQTGDDEICIEIKEDSTASEPTHGSSAATGTPRTEITLPTIPKTPKPGTSLPPPCNGAKRSYQVRWRTEFMMDYDCRRQGLICMVCGGTLATLKVSTIKRHIVQVHPYSVDFTPEERQRILEAYSEMALHYIHSEDCFKAQPQEEGKGRKRKSEALEEA